MVPRLHDARRGSRLLARALLVLALAIGACACGGSGAGGDEGTLRIGTRNVLDILNPFNAFNHQSFVAFHMMYPTLITYGDKDDFVGDWADTWETSDDGRVWTFKLRKGEWSDGTALTAEDAVWTGNTIIKYAEGPAAYLAATLSHATKFEAPDPQTLVITYEKPVANVLSQLTQFWILPKHIWQPQEGSDGKGLKTYNAVAKLPIVGAGPFLLTSYNKRGVSLFERNDSYYGQDKPELEKVGVQFFTNGDGLVQAFRNGEVDYMDIRSAPVNALDSLADGSGVEVIRKPGPQQTFFGNNSNPKKTKHKELQDLRLRQAFEHAIDREEIADVVFNNYAKPVVAQVAPDAGKWMHTGLKPLAFDLAAANRILDQAGFKRGSDGLRVTADGRKMEYTVITPTDSSYNMNREFEIIQTAFQKIGVRLSQRALDEDTTFDEVTGPDGKYLSSDLYLWDYDGTKDPDFILSVLICEQYGGWNDSGYCNPEYDRLYEEQAVTMDEAKRKQIVWKMQEIAFRDRPYIWIVNLELISVRRDPWQGFDPELEGRSKRAWTGISSGG
jgi:peptide/nickel transport system substrate-binding protein